DRDYIIPDTEIVPGDILLIDEGEKIPADARLIVSNGLRVDESSLTGESIPIDKEDRSLQNKHAALTEQINMLFKGTVIVGGNGRAIVVKTGKATEIGKLSTQLVTLKSEIPLQNELRHLSRLILIGACAISGVIFFLGLLAGQQFIDMVAVVVTLAVSIIPEGLPIVITLVLANGVWRMARRQALVKKLEAVEALGQAEVIAVDKTGTLTKNEMIVRKVFVNDTMFDVSGTGYAPTGSITEYGADTNPLTNDGLRTLNRVAVLTTNASLAFDEKKNDWTVHGDPTEAAIMVLGKKIGMSKEDIERDVPRVAEIPFHYKEKYHATLHHGPGHYFINVAGAPEIILNASTTLYSAKSIVPLTAAKRKEIEDQIRIASEQGLRVICFAYIQAKGTSLLLLERAHITKLTFVGFYCLEDSLRPEARTAVLAAQNAGIRIVMLTGDQITTALALAGQVGIYHEGERVLTGSDVESMTIEELSRALDTTTVFARVTPDHKLKIIQGYKARGEIVAMTGDGVNDAPALVAADLGIGMGKIGTAVAKEASDIILLDDNFASIVAAVEEGRSIYHTTRKVILFLFGTNLGEVLLIAGAFIVGLPLPLLPAQIIWLNLVTDSFLDVSLAMEPKEKGILARMNSKKRALVDKHMMFRMLFLSLPTAIGACILFALTYPAGLEKAGTLVLTTIAVAQWFNAWNCRTETTSIFRSNPFSNLYLVGALGIVITLQLAALYTPILQNILHTVPLNGSDWLICIGIASLVVVAEELRKLIVRIRLRQTRHKFPTPLLQSQ
ncbi:MAG: HAD-IC family P-type ATPase, partial [Candidatus Uhrbacteria bacterium]|nr:HAD-IC family P-type ATPase [Candidatus Uhrbacteria bacterium]